MLNLTPNRINRRTLLVKISFKMVLFTWTVRSSIACSNIKLLFLYAFVSTSTLFTEWHDMCWTIIHIFQIRCIVHIIRNITTFRIYWNGTDKSSDYRAKTRHDRWFTRRAQVCLSLPFTYCHNCVCMSVHSDCLALSVCRIVWEATTFTIRRSYVLSIRKVIVMQIHIVYNVSNCHSSVPPLEMVHGGNVLAVGVYMVMMVCSWIVQKLMLRLSSPRQWHLYPHCFLSHVSINT